MHCKICKEKNCIGYYLLHPSELHKIDNLKDRHIGANFKLITSPSSGEYYVRFKELHVIEN